MSVTCLLSMCLQDVLRIFFLVPVALLRYFSTSGSSFKNAVAPSAVLAQM